MTEPEQFADYGRPRQRVIEWLDAPCNCCGRPNWTHLASLIRPGRLFDNSRWGALIDGSIAPQKEGA